MAFNSMARHPMKTASIYPGDLMIYLYRESFQARRPISSGGQFDLAISEAGHCMSADTPPGSGKWGLFASVRIFFITMITELEQDISFHASRATLVK
jgi:hypothetical protein